jgi:hypothetical protein
VRGCQVVSVTDRYGHILGFLDRKKRTMLQQYLLKQNQLADSQIKFGNIDILEKDENLKKKMTVLL